jgi:hypothetical protein
MKSTGLLTDIDRFHSIMIDHLQAVSRIDRRNNCASSGTASEKKTRAIHTPRFPLYQRINENALIMAINISHGSTAWQTKKEKGEEELTTR